LQKNDLSISPKNGELEKGEEITIDMYLQKNDLSISPNSVSIKDAKLKFINLSDTNNPDAKTGTTTKKIRLKVIQHLEKPSNLNVELLGDSLKKLKYTWTTSILSNITGHNIYMANYDTERNSCSRQYIGLFSTLSNTSIEMPFDKLQIEAGKKYCFKVSSYKISFTGITFFDVIDRITLNESELSDEAILTIPSYGSLKSSIIDSVTRNPIENATIYLTSVATNTRTDGLGNYMFENLLPGKYRVVIEAEGYGRETGDITIEEGKVNLFEQVLVPNEDLVDIEGTISGKVQNALNATGISGVTMEIRKGVNVLSGEIIETLTTDSSGNYTLSLKTGSYTVSMKADGYKATSATLVIVGNQTKKKDLTLSPILADNSMRIILNWGQNPRDLDSHLVKKINGSQKYHIYYRSHNIGRGQSPTIEGDQLDHDDRYSYGPETVTIQNVDANAVYTYYVHHYFGSSSLKNSSAKVEVNYGNQNILPFNVPNEDGRYWKVFEIVNGEVIQCTSNCLQNSTSSLIRKLDRNSDSYLFRNLPTK